VEIVTNPLSLVLIGFSASLVFLDFGSLVPIPGCLLYINLTVNSPITEPIFLHPFQFIGQAEMFLPYKRGSV
jgi:hypothetical protein